MDFETNPATYRWSVRLFSLLRRLLKIGLKLHEAGDKLAEGDIFLFNHFARFETFIPQYFIYLGTGEFEIASAHFRRQCISLTFLPNRNNELRSKLIHCRTLARQYLVSVGQSVPPTRVRPSRQAPVCLGKV